MESLLQSLLQQQRAVQQQVNQGGGAAGGGGANDVDPKDMSMLLRLLEENHALQQQLKLVKLDNARLMSQLSQMDGSAKDEMDGGKDDPNNPKSRYWTAEEHQLFLEAVSCFGFKDVKAISIYVGTRNPTQVRTHAQKYMLKMQKQAPNSIPENPQQLAVLAPSLQPVTQEALLHELHNRSGGALGIAPPSAQERDNSDAGSGGE